MRLDLNPVFTEDGPVVYATSIQLLTLSIKAPTKHGGFHPVMAKAQVIIESSK